MKLSLSSVLLAVSLPSLVLAQERARDAQKHQRYASGEVMEGIMARKEAAWRRAGERGLFNPRKFRSTNKFTPCTNNRVNLQINGTAYSFQCSNLDVTGHLTHGDLGSTDTAADIGNRSPSPFDLTDF